MMTMTTSLDIPQAEIITGTVSLGEVDSFGDASSPCKITVAPLVSFPTVFGMIETCAGPKSPGENTCGLKG
jgi:hypothetical protein